MKKIKEFYVKYEDNKWFKIAVVTVGLILAWCSQYVPIQNLSNVHF
ncbi:MAG: hypothetical protein ACYCSW_09510 [bacterium]